MAKLTRAETKTLTGAEVHGLWLTSYSLAETVERYDAMGWLDPDVATDDQLNEASAAFHANERTVDLLARIDPKSEWAI